MARQVGRQERDGRELFSVPKPGEFFLRTAETMEKQDQVLASIP